MTDLVQDLENIILILEAHPVPSQRINNALAIARAALAKAERK